MPPELKSVAAGIAARRASEIIRQWPADRPFEVQAVLGESPELADSKSLIIDLAYEEFCQARARQPSLSAESFAARFPAIQKTLIRTLEVHDYMEQDVQRWAGASVPPWPAAGTCFQDFHLVVELGRGAAARAYLAEDMKLANRAVVVKLTRQVEREAGALGRLQHPNIVPVLGVWEDPQSSLSAIGMPFLGRATLMDVLDAVAASGSVPASSATIFDAVQCANADVQEILPPLGKPRWSPNRPFVDGVVQIGIQLADALAYAHDCGVYHGDVKPSNVLVTADGTAMLFDFNLAFSPDLASQAVGGTFPYMAPEQLRWFVDKSRQLDARSDLFSLAATLCEVLTGQLPFGPAPSRVDPPEKTAKALLDAQREREHQMPPGMEKIDPKIARILKRCLALNPDDRPSSAAELAAALRKTQRPSARLVRWCLAHKAVASLVACCVGALAIVTVAWGVTREPAWDREMRLGREAAVAADYEGAVEHYGKALDENPESLEALFWRGYTRLKVAEFNLARQNAAGETDKVHRAVVLHDLNAAYEDLDVYASQSGDVRGDALAGYCEALKTCMPPPANVGAMASAASHFMDACKGGFTTAALQNNLGDRFIYGNNPESANGYLHEALRLHPDLAMAHYNLCRSDTLAARLKKRCPDLELADRVARYPFRTPGFHLDLATCYARAGYCGKPTKQQVLEHCREAIALGASIPDFRQVTSHWPDLEIDKEFISLMEGAPDGPPAPKMNRCVDPLFGTEDYLASPDPVNP